MARDTNTLFTNALNVVNTAIEKNRRSPVIGSLIQATEKLADDRKFGVAVYESDASSPFDYYTIRFRDGSFELVERGKNEPEIDWKVSRSYLEKVVDDSDTYVEHPSRLDWDWLKSRVGAE